MRTLDIGRPLDINGLRAARTVPPGGYEANEEPLYDTVTYLAAGSASLDFFSVASGDRTITNLAQPGMIPQGEFFHAKRLFLIPLIEATAPDAAAGSRSRDLDRVTITNRGICTITPAYSNRPRGPYPLHMLGAVGANASHGFGTTTADTAASELPRASTHGGIPLDIVLAGGETFGANIRFGNVQAITADMPLQLVLWGFRYRQAA